MKNYFFTGDTETYHVSSYFYRIEFQQRGAPHVHSLLWMKNQKNEDAPNFWIDTDSVAQEEAASKQDQCKSQQDKHSINNEARIKQVKQFADFLISTSSEDIFCDKHGSTIEQEETLDCTECTFLKEKVDKYQRHNHLGWVV